MKKNLLIAGVAAAVMMSATMTYAEPTKAADIQPAKTSQTQCKKMPPKDFKGPHRPPKMERPNFDERLKLTDEQKQKAREIRMDGHKQMKPIFDKMMAKKAEIKKIEESNISESKKEKQILAIEKELLNLKMEARKVRINNAKQFEAILTAEQKAEFEKIKQEGRERAKQLKKHKHPAHPCPIKPRSNQK